MGEEDFESRLLALEALVQPMSSAELRASYSGQVASVISVALCKALSDAGLVDVSRLTADLQAASVRLLGSDPHLRNAVLDELQRIHLFLQRPAAASAQ